MRSLGDELHRVKAGVLEVPANAEVALYKGQHSHEEAVEFLNSNNFQIIATGDSQNEKNLYFTRKD